MQKHNPANERIKRRYFAFLKEACIPVQTQQASSTGGSLFSWCARKGATLP
jgi:hypothetical protein